MAHDQQQNPSPNQNSDQSQSRARASQDGNEGAASQTATGATAANDATYAVCPSCLKLNKISVARAAKSKSVCGNCKSEIQIQGAIFSAGTQQLQKLIQASPIPVVVDFWAPWCAPCRSFAPTFERASREFIGRVVFVKVNTEENMFASQAFGIRGIPALLLYRNALELSRQAGALPYEHFVAWMNQTLS